jgi:hypothetical protein
MAEFANECFFIAPIGKAASPERKRSDGVRDFIVTPAVAELGLEVLRADQIGEPGQITHQVSSTFSVHAQLLLTSRIETQTSTTSWRFATQRGCRSS